MSSTWPFVINLVNTAFGVTVLAVPYCFHQCGLILGALLLIASSYASKKSCSLLLRSAQISRKRDLESLGFHVGGFLLKFLVEMSLIGYLVGTAITWFVVIGDVSPAVVSSLFGVEKTWGLRLFLIVAIGLGIVLPLALVKDINSLSSASKVAIAIYTMFVLQLLFSTLPRIFSGDWLYGINFWKPEGVLQCLPIFGISFLCQTVIFVLYESLPDPSVKKMEHVVSTAMDIVLLLSFTVGFSGYVRYYEDGVEGDLLNNYSHGFISEFIRLGFCISTILSFPLLVFPCRASINSLISSARIDVIPGGGSYIPHDRFITITLCLILGTMICGVMFPSVEFVMALVGATMGAMLTFILPSLIFLKVSGEDNSKAEAKALLVIGICLFFLSTFAVVSVGESKTKEMTLVVNPVQPVLNPPTFKSNKSFSKTSEDAKKVEVLLHKIDKANKSIAPSRQDLRKRKTIDEEKVLVPQRNTAEVVQESRKEPALPQEGRVVVKVPQEDETAKRLAESKLTQQQPDTNVKSKDTDLRNPPAKTGVDLPTTQDGPPPDVLGLRDQNSRLKKTEDMKLVSHHVGKNDEAHVRESRDSDGEDRVLNDEVRLGERKILNNGEDPAVGGGTTTTKQSKLETNISLPGQGKFTPNKNMLAEKDTKTSPTTSKNEIITSTRIQSNIKPSNKSEVLNDIELREKTIDSHPKIQPPLLLRQKLQESKIKLEQSRRKRWTN